MAPTMAKKLVGSKVKTMVLITVEKTVVLLVVQTAAM